MNSSDTTVRDSSRQVLDDKRPALERLEQQVYQLLLDEGPMHDRRLLEALNQREMQKPKSLRHTWGIDCVTPRRYYCITKGWAEDLGLHRGLWEGKVVKKHIWRAKYDTRLPAGWTLVVDQDHVCTRCGLCCMDVGPNFWRSSEHPLIKWICDKTTPDSCSDHGPCDALIRHGDTSTCLLQKHLKYKAKPLACRDYPRGVTDDGRCAWQDQQDAAVAAPAPEYLFPGVQA